MRLWLCAAVLLASCHGKDEARVLVAAVDAYRAASNEDKPGKADALDKVPCTDDQVCAVKAACTKSADATAKGLRLQKEVDALGYSDAGKYDEQQSKWKEAGKDIQMGYGLLEACRLKTDELRAQYSL